MTPVEVVKHASSGEAIFAVAQRRMQAGKYEDALVLFEQAADRGSVPAFKALAQLYDPNGFEPGKPFRNPDFRTAASYYKEAVAHGDSDATAPREALRQRLEKDAREGNGMAASALKEFWP
jgi:TPR repeat protein